MKKGLYHIPAPPNIPEGYTNQVKGYNVQVTKTMASLFVFALSYLITFAIAAAICAGLGILGFYMLVAGVSSFIFYLFAAASFVFAFVMLLFTLQFFFWIPTPEKMGTDISEEEAPGLFQLVRETAAELNAPMPHRIAFTMNINAAVMRYGGILAFMFRKRNHLILGLPLISSLNQSELKAIIAHELAHFSQRSTWLLGFLAVASHTAQRVLQNSQSSIDTLVWFSKFGVISVVANLAYQTIQLLRKIPAKAFDLFYFSYQGLSRAMENHADLTSASIAGTYNTIHALRRSEFATMTHGLLMETILNIFYHQELQAVNVNYFYQNYFARVSVNNDLELEPESNLPLITDSDLNRLIASRIHYADVWSSHPSLKEREAFLHSKPLPQDADTCRYPALDLLADAEATARKMSRAMYGEVNQSYIEQAQANPGNQIKTFKEGDTTILENEEFEPILKAELAKLFLPPLYGNYFWQRSFYLFDVEEEVASLDSATVKDNLKELFENEAINLASNHRLTQEAYDVLLAIQNKQIDTPYFELDGEPYRRKQANAQANRIKKELDAYTEELKVHDRLIFRSFYAYANALKPDVALKFKSLLSAYFTLTPLAEKTGQAQMDIFYALVSLDVYNNEDHFGSVAHQVNTSEKAVSDVLQELVAIQEHPAADYFEDLKTIRQHLLAEDILSMSISNFNADDAAKLYEQVAPMREKFYDLMNTLFFAIFDCMEEIRMLEPVPQAIEKTLPE